MKCGMNLGTIQATHSASCQRRPTFTYIQDINALHLCSSTSHEFATMSAMDKITQAAEKAAHNVQETMTGAHVGGKEKMMHAQEGVADTGRSAHETATTASHIAQEAGQQTKHSGESMMDKAKHAVGL